MDNLHQRKTWKTIFAAKSKKIKKKKFREKENFGL